MRKSPLTCLFRIAKTGVVIGLAGGVAEIVWIAIYGNLAAVDAINVAAAVSATIALALPDILPVSVAALSGIAIHMVLAIGLGIALAFVWFSAAGRRSRQFNEYAFMVAALIAVWSLNFFVVLPLVNPAFVKLVPYPVSLVSKILFGLSGAAVLQHCMSGWATPMPFRALTRRNDKKDRPS